MAEQKKRRSADEIPWSEWVYELTKGNLAAEGYNTGPGWSDGKYQESVPTTLAKSELDKTSAEHDTTLYEIANNPEYSTEYKTQLMKSANEKYYNQNWGKGLFRSGAALAVKYGGPTGQAPKRLRGNDNQMIPKQTSKKRADPTTEEEWEDFRYDETDWAPKLRESEEKKEYQRLQNEGGTSLQRQLAALMPDPDEEDSLFNLPDSALVDPTEEMEVDSGKDGEPVPEGEARMASASGGPGMGSVSKETPISIYPTLTYGLQETHTTILPWTGWFSYGWLDKTAPLKFSIRLNSIWDMFPNAIVDLPAAGATIGAKALFNRPVGTNGANAVNGTFPATMAAGTTTTERPQWRDYWAQLYEYYTVLGCEWKVTITNEQTTRNADVVVGETQDSYSDTAGAGSNVTPDAPLGEMMAFKGTKWSTIHAPSGTDNLNGEPSMMVLKGRYRPGSIKRNIVNDGDVKTWTKTTTTLPTLKDNQNFCLFQSALAVTAPGTTTSGCGNVQVEIKYIVQFKDLFGQARYPNTVLGTAISQGINPINTSITAGQADDHVRYRQ